MGNMRRQGEIATGILSFRLVLNKKVDYGALQRWIATKDIAMQDANQESFAKSHTRKVQWTESDPTVWRGTCPVVDVWYSCDPEHCFLYKIFLQVERVQGEQMWDEEGLKERFQQEL